MGQLTTAPVFDRIYWHPDLHFKLHEYVRYYRVRLVSRYVSDEIFHSFKALCEYWDVGTYSILEVYGSHDLIIRLYSKQTRAFNEAFINWLRSPIEGSDIKMEGEPDDFDTCLYHWLWTDKNGDYQKLSTDCLNRVARSPQEMMQRLIEPDNDADAALAKKVVRFESQPEAGIRFLVMITGGEKGKLTSEQREVLADDIINEVRAIDGVKCLEAYRGSLEGWLIIDGRVDYVDYTSINQLKDYISRTRISYSGCRATSYLCCDNVNGVDESEHLYIADADGGALSDDDLIQMLNQPESERFETKGSLRMDMQEFFTTGKKLKIKIDKGKPDPILKTIAAFVNGEGGILIVGALEEENMARNGCDISSLPSYGEYRICGIDADFLEKGFDKAQRHLIGLIRRQWDIGVAQLVEVRRLTVEEKYLMAVIVQKSGELQPYLDEFYVRNGATTVSMTPRETLEYAKNRL